MEKTLSKNISGLQKEFGDSDELIVKELKVGNTNCAIVYVLGICDTIALSKFVICPLLEHNSDVTSIDKISRVILSISEVVNETVFDNAVTEILKGKAVLFVDGFEEALIFGVDKYKERSLEEPPTSTVIKGPRSGFIENIKTNLAVMRKIMATTSFRTKHLKIGKYTQTSITIAYIDGIADMEIVGKVHEKLSRIDIDGILDSNYISKFLEEHPNSMFKQIGFSEKPDVISSKLLEGRVAIFVDGSPIVLTVPFIYLEDLQSGDDYYTTHSKTTYIRWLRIVSIFISILIPALYVAVVLHHNRVIPLKFLVTIINSTKGIPFTPFAEILFVLILFEILYEASLRMPRYLGLALSVVGALILGDTAVKAGLISPPAVMIVAISGLTIYCIPDQAPQLYILRLVFTFAGAMLGLFGITAMLIFVIAYLCDFDSYKTPYFAPLAPFIAKDMKDCFYKTSLVNMDTRPKSISNNKDNLYRQGGSRGKKDID